MQAQGAGPHQVRQATVTQAVAERLATTESSHQQFRQASGQGIGFYTGDDGFLYCDNLKVDDIRSQVSVDKD